MEKNGLQEPELSAGILYFEKAAKHLFFVPNIPNWLVVNKNSATLLFSCNGQKSEEVIFDSFGFKGEVRHNAHLLFKEAQKRGVLKGASTQQSNEPVTSCSCVNDIDIQTDRLRSVYLKLTDECNLHCNYCYAGSGKPSANLTIDVLRKTLKEVPKISRSIEFVLT